jgi:hypothetical protein
MKSIIQWLVAISWVLPSAATATDWVKLGQDREVEAYYDRESLRIVDYQLVADLNSPYLTKYGQIRKALVVTVLYNYLLPTKCPEGDCLGQPVNSVSKEWGITCSDVNIWYWIGSTATSGKFLLGRKVDDVAIDRWDSNFHYIHKMDLVRVNPGPLQRKMLRQVAHLCEIPREEKTGIDWSKEK